MATLPISNNQFNTTVTLSKRTSNIFTFNTRNTFVDKNIRLRVDVQSAITMLSATANATVNSVEQFFDADSDTFKINGTGTLRGTATLSVQRAGWLATTNIPPRVPISNTLYLDDLIELPKIQLSTTFTSAFGAVKPIIETSNLAGNFINAASGSTTTQQPTTGVYVAVQSQADTTTITAHPTVTAEGYGTPTQGEYSYTNATANVGATASDITYIPITLGEISADSASAGVNLYTTDGANAGVNISNVVGTKNSQEPTTGYYLAFQADATGGSRVTRAGWVNEGVLAPATGASIQYFPISTATMSITGGNLIAGSGYSSLQNKGYYDGASYNISDKIDITSQTSPAEGYYVLEAHGSGIVNRAAINRQVTQAGYAPADAQEVVAQEAINDFASAIAVNNYYIKKSTLSTTSITSSSVNQDITISAGYYPSPRTITVQGMTATTVTTSYSSEGFTTYFTEGTSTDSNISITPLFSNEAGFISQHINANNGGTGYWKIINTSTTYTAATVDNTAFSQGRAQWGTGWINAGNINGASFNNRPTDYVNYLDISDTTGAPIIPAGGYLYINKGYTDNVRISLAKLIPDDATITINPNTELSDQMLSGYSAYNSNGTLVLGSIPTKGREDIGINGQTITIPSGYYAQPISQSVQGGEIKSGAATAVLSDPYYNIDNDNFTINATGVVALPIVTREGYVSSAGTAGKTGNTVSGTGSLNLIGLSTTSTGDLITTPVIQRTIKPAADTWIDAANGAATTVKPTSGAYVQVDANANISTVAIRSIVTSAGYGTTDHYAATTDSYIVGAAKAQTRYIPIKMASVTSTAPTLSVTATAGTINITKQPSVSATVTSIMAGIDGGYYTDNTTSPYTITFSASATANGATIEATGGTAEATVSESQVSITEGYNITPTAVVNSAITNSQIGSTTTITVDTVSKNVNTTIYLKPAVISITGGGLTASTGYGSLTSSGYYNGSSYDTGDKVMITTTQASGYYKLIASGYGTVSRAAITQQVTTAGYMPATTQTNYSNVTSLNSNTGSTNYYIKKSTLSIQDNISNGNALLVQSGNSDKTVTVSAGYYPSDRTIIVQKVDDITEGEITSGTGTLNFGLPNYNGTNSNFIVSTTATIAPPIVNTAGMISETVGVRNGNSISGLLTLNRVTVGTSYVSGNYTRTPNIVKTNKPSADTWIDAGAGQTITTTKPTSGPYVRVDAAANTNSLVIKGAVTSEGYGTTSYYNSNSTTYTVGSAKATTKYIPIKTGSVTMSTVNDTANPDITFDESTGVISADYSKTVSATATVTEGWISSGTNNNITISGNSTLSLGLATFSNTSNGASYLDISNTTKAPILTSGGYLYVNKGYTDNIKISLAKLIPDDANISATNQILSGYSAYDKDGTLIVGTIPSKGTTTYNVSTSNQTIASGTYLSGTQTFRAVSTTGIVAANIKDGVVIKVGDAGNSGRIKNITGTFTDASTVSSGQTAASTGQILSGYSAWVDGAEVKGNIAPRNSGNLTVSGSAVTALAGYYASDATTNVAAGFLSATATISNGSASITSTGFAALTGTNTSNYYITLTTSAGSATPTASVSKAGYVDSSSNKTGTAITVGVDGNNTKLYIPTATATASLESYTAPHITATVVTENIATTTTNTGYKISINTTYTAGQIYGKATIGSTTGMVAAGTSHTSGKQTITPSIDSDEIFIPQAEIEVSARGTAILSITPTLSVTAASSNTIENKTRLFITPTTNTNIDTDYYIPIKATTVRTTAYTAINGLALAFYNEGYLKELQSGDTIPNSNISGSVTATLNATTSTYYLPIPAASLTATTTITNASASITASSYVSTTSTANNYYIQLNTTAGSATANANVKTAGYVTSSQNTSSTSISVPVDKNTSKIYITPAAVTITALPYVDPEVKLSSSNVITGAVTATEPSDGYYLKVYGHYEGKTITPSITINSSGYLRYISQIDTSSNNNMRILGKNGDFQYIPIQKAILSATAILDREASATMVPVNIATTNTSSYYIQLNTNTALIYPKPLVSQDGYITTDQSQQYANSLIVGVPNNGERIYIPKAQIGVSTTATITGVKMTTGDKVSFKELLSSGSSDVTINGDRYYVDATTAIMQNSNGSFGYVPLTMSATGTAATTISTTAGYVPTTSTAAQIDVPVQMNITRYLNSVIVAPGQHFVINVPNGSSSSYISFRFCVDANANVYIDSVG